MPLPHRATKISMTLIQSLLPCQLSGNDLEVIATIPLHLSPAQMHYQLAEEIDRASGGGNSSGNGSAKSGGSSTISSGTGMGSGVLAMPTRIAGGSNLSLNPLASGGTFLSLTASGNFRVHNNGKSALHFTPNCNATDEFWASSTHVNEDREEMYRCQSKVSQGPKETQAEWK